MAADPTAVGTGGLDRLFHFSQWGTSLKRDTLAGLTTFMVMAYIIFVNPTILGLGGDLAGLPFAAALTSTCLVAGVMTILMGLVTNRAYALAPGMGLNAVVAFSLVLGQGLTMKSAMGLIVLEGVAITILVLTGFREAIFKAIPRAQKGDRGRHRLLHPVHRPGGRRVINVNGGTPVALVDLGSVRPPLAVAVFGLVVTIVMLARRWRAAILLGIVFATVFAIVMNYLWGKDVASAGSGGHPHHIVCCPTSASSGPSTSAPSPSSGSPPRPVDLQPHAERLLRHHGHARRCRRRGGLPGQEGRSARTSNAAARRLRGRQAGGAVRSSSATTYIESGAGVARRPHRVGRDHRRRPVPRGDALLAHRRGRPGKATAPR